MHNRCPKNIEGDFYTTGECLVCDVPESEAPSLLAPLDNGNIDTYFIKQPVTDAEISQTIAATEMCCVNAVRYGGKNKSIIKRLNSEVCDYMILSNGLVTSNTN